MPISFFLNGKIKRLNKKTELIERIKLLAFLECKEIGNISVIFLSDDELLAINKQFLKHNYYTDIITFDYTKNNVISGELYLSIDRIKENALTFKVSTDEELRRVILHGILHLCGYKDKSSKDLKKMRKKEDYYLNLKVE
jgi:rRNA maturation RNase YbeY